MSENNLKPEYGDVILYVGDNHMYIVEPDLSVVRIEKNETDLDLTDKTYDRMIGGPGFAVYRGDKKIYADRKYIENLERERAETLKKLESIDKELNDNV